VTDRTPAPFGRRRALVVSVRAVGAYVLVEVADRGGPDPDPGQFYMLAAQEGWGAGEDERPFLPRAISAMGGRSGTLWFLLEATGPGTRRLARARKGEALWLTGPLGAGFEPPADGRRPVLVAGGIGLPPIVAWSRALAERGVEQTILAGFRDLRHAEIAASLQGVRVATDDGSAGHHGYVTELLAAELDHLGHAEVYACGPPGMLEAVRAMVVGRSVPGQLALESGMACGFGACFGCVAPLAAGGYVRVCVDGPVLEAARLAGVPAH
jgi:NAD(P)H-flavin reductase